MPTGAFIDSFGTTQAADVTGDADGTTRNARDATDVAGTSNPDIESVVASNADQTGQSWGHRRFVSRPLAAHTFATADGSWTFSYARSESSLNHNQAVKVGVYCWRPSTGLRVGSGSNAVVAISGTEPTSASTEQAESITASWGSTSVTIQDGDILVFEVSTVFTQSHSTSYNDNFAYDGTTEASTTTCASFVTPPAALTLFTAGAAYVRPTIVIPRTASLVAAAR